MENTTEPGKNRIPCVRHGSEYVLVCSIARNKPNIQQTSIVFCPPCRSVAAVESVRQKGKICILDIDIQGVQKVKQSTLKPVLYLFIAPPSMEALEKRLRGRGTETEEQLNTRLGNAAKELEYGYVPLYTAMDIFTWHLARCGRLVCKTIEKNVFCCPFLAVVYSTNAQPPQAAGRQL
jgi:Guanylate kinase